MHVAVASLCAVGNVASILILFTAVTQGNGERIEIKL